MTAAVCCLRRRLSPGPIDPRHRSLSALRPQHDCAERDRCPAGLEPFCSTDGWTKRPGGQRPRSPPSRRAIPRKANRRHSERKCASYSMTTRYTSARRCTTTEGPTGVATRLVRRDASFDSDNLDIEIDAYHDHLSRAVFQVNPAGSKADQIGIGTSCCDASWDPVWEVATHIDEDGWTAEMRIRTANCGSRTTRCRCGGSRSGGSSSGVTKGTSGLHTEKRSGRTVTVRSPVRHSRPASSAHLELLPYAVTKSSSVPGAAAIRSIDAGGRRCAPGSISRTG